MLRHVQEYGSTYHTRSKTSQQLGKGIKTTPIPIEFESLCQRLVEQKLMARTPEQVIVNEYVSGQGIAAHTDDTKMFSDQIVSISLLSGIIMDFDGPKSAAWSVYLKPNSCVALSGDARYLWKHSIPKRKSDLVSGKRVARSRRISITFRLLLA